MRGQSAIFEVAGAIGEHVHELDGDHVVVDGLRILGVGGIIGNKQTPAGGPKTSNWRASPARSRRLAMSSCCTKGSVVMCGNSVTRQSVT
jgi:hypothetical protein